MTRRVWQAHNRKKAKGKLVQKKSFEEPIKIEKPKKIKLKRKLKEDVIAEKAHAQVLAALKAKPPEVLDKVLKARDSVGAHDSGLSAGEPAKGSSRAVLHVKNDHLAMVDGKAATMKGIVKMAHKEDKHIEVGQAQNRVEASAKVQKYATLVRDGKGGFKTNKKGVVPPVFKHGNNHTFIHAGHAEDVDDHDIAHMTKTKSHPDGLSLYDISSATDPQREGRFAPGHDIHKHPLVKAIKAFRKATGIGDLHHGNVGAWTHPHTGEKHLVIRDAGFDRSVAKHYGYNRPGDSKAKSNPTQVTGSMGMRGAQTPVASKRQYSLDVKQPQHWKQDARAANPPNTEKKYNAAMGEKRYAEAKAHYKANPPNTKEVERVRKAHFAGKAPREKWDAAHNMKVHNKVKGILQHKKTADINTADAHKVRVKYLAPIHGVPGESAGHETNNHAANLAYDNREKRNAAADGSLRKKLGSMVKRINDNI